MYVNEKRAKFNVGSLVKAPYGLPGVWRGNWGYSTGPVEIKVDPASAGLTALSAFSAFSTDATYKVAKVWLREELSVNGNRLEYYYELEGGNGARIREEFFEGDENRVEIFQQRGRFEVDEFYAIDYNTTAASAPDGAVYELQGDEPYPRTITSEDVRRISNNQQRIRGFYTMQVTGAWYSTDAVEFEFDGSGLDSAPIRFGRMLCSFAVKDGEVDYNTEQFESGKNKEAFTLQVRTAEGAESQPHVLFVASDECMQNFKVECVEMIDSDR